MGMTARGTIFALSLALSPSVKAEGNLTASLSLFYFTESSTRNSSNAGAPYAVKVKDSYLWSAIGACYQLSPVCLGLKYLQADIETKSSANRCAGRVLTRFSGPGISLGYASTTVVAQVNWLVNASKSVDNEDLSRVGSSGSAAVRYPAKQAYMLDLGYGFPVGSVRMGPLLSVLNFSYEKLVFSGQTVSLAAAERDEFLVPQVALWMDL